MPSDVYRCVAIDHAAGTVTFARLGTRTLVNAYNSGAFRVGYGYPPGPDVESLFFPVLSSDEEDEVTMDENKALALGWLATLYPSTARLVPDGWGLAFPPECPPNGRVAACLVHYDGTFAVVVPGRGLDGGWTTMPSLILRGRDFVSPSDVASWPALHDYLRSIYA